MPEVEIGAIEHYFDKVGVGAFTIKNGDLSVGDTIHVKGHTTDFTTTVESIQIEHAKVAKAVNGDSVGIKLGEKAREHDKVYRVTE